MLILMWILAIIFLIILLGMIAEWTLSAPSYKGNLSDHFNGTTFHNIDQVPPPSIYRMLTTWLFSARVSSWKQEFEASTNLALDTSDDIRITYINHCTFLIQIRGINILTDPIWSNRCGPTGFLGLKRRISPGIAFESLPPIDMVLISHNHYDHMDLPTIHHLEKVHQPLFIVPLGNKEFLQSKAVLKVIELDWWQTLENAIKITATPARHMSGRSLRDRDSTLWCGYLIQTSDFTIYFAGDTGYSEFITTLPQKAGRIDVSLLPIGAYQPESLLSSVQMSSKEAVKAHKMIRSRQSIAMHFGTFPLAQDHPGQAEEDLILTLQQLGISQKEFLIPEPGGTMIFFPRS